MSGNLSPILYRPLPIMNKQEIITKVKNPPGEILSIVCILNEMFLAFKRCCDYCQSMDCESCLFFFLFSSANKCFLKVATYAAQLEQYQKAVEIFEQV